MSAKKKTENRISVRFPDPKGFTLVKSAVKKNNDESENGEKIKISSYLRIAGIEKAKRDLESRNG